MLLMELALNHSCSSAGAAAEVLLSCYREDHYQLNVLALGKFDPAHLQAAFTVMACRINMHILPQNLIRDGEKTFDQLRSMYPKLDLNKRWRADCHHCKGSGEIWTGDDDTESYAKCTHCKGAGQLRKSKLSLSSCKPN